MQLAMLIMGLLQELLPLIETALAAVKSAPADAGVGGQVAAAVGAITATHVGVDAHTATTAAHIAVAVAPQA